MSSNIIEYSRTLHENTSKALEDGYTSMASVLPCMVFRELSVLDGPFVASSDPLMQSFFSLRRNQRFPNGRVPRKIEFGSAVYLQEALIERLSSNDTVVLFIGDSNSDKRFAYNYQRLVQVSEKQTFVHCFISNSDLVSTRFGDDIVRDKWDRRHFFYHANSWEELSGFRENMLENHSPKNVVSIIDMDGTLLCPRPEYSGFIRRARLEALKKVCAEEFEVDFFNPKSLAHEKKLLSAFEKAEATGFGSSYDDADLTALIALAIYADIIDQEDDMLNPVQHRGFVLPVECLDYASTAIENAPVKRPGYANLHSLFGICTDAIRNGAASAFSTFRISEEQVLLSHCEDEKVVLNRAVISYINETSRLGGVSIGFSDRPNASLGVQSSNNLAGTCEPKSGETLINATLAIR